MREGRELRTQIGLGVKADRLLPSRRETSRFLVALISRFGYSHTLRNQVHV